MGQRNTMTGAEKFMYGENAAEILWTATEETILTLAREMEWAEAYAVNHPDCPMGNIYLEFLHRELVTAQGES